MGKITDHPDYRRVFDSNPGIGDLVARADWQAAMADLAEEVGDEEEAKKYRAYSNWHRWMAKHHGTPVRGGVTPK